MGHHRAVRKSEKRRKTTSQFTHAPTRAGSHTYMPTVGIDTIASDDGGHRGTGGGGGEDQGWIVGKGEY